MFDGRSSACARVHTRAYLLNYEYIHAPWYGIFFLHFGGDRTFTPITQWSSKICVKTNSGVLCSTHRWKYVSNCSCFRSWSKLKLTAFLSRVLKNGCVRQRVLGFYQRQLIVRGIWNYRPKDPTKSGITHSLGHILKLLPCPRWKGVSNSTSYRLPLQNV